MKFVIALQFYGGDRDKAMRLARLIADVTLPSRHSVEFLFVARYDCDHDQETIKYVAKKFPICWTTTYIKWRGWPGGPNAMALHLLQWMATMRPHNDGLLMFEPDCVPTSPFWLDALIDCWENAVARGKWIMGSWRNSGGVHGHINGNCVVRADLANLIPLVDLIGPDYAWDCAIAPLVKDHWDISGVIKNCFECRNAGHDSLFIPEIGEESPALVHGHKDDSAYEIARRVCTENQNFRLS